MVLCYSRSSARSSLEGPCICRQPLRLHAIVKNKWMYYLRDGGYANLSRNLSLSLSLCHWAMMLKN
ncbi:hypothetical protein KFK09_010671 [Dendrobium nobile]|uniref:Uncharacterized protein n=1 Tax=Dendrobium nobile TaxID=94219 RepID=A0A8T3BDE0_DENNO|nr:hypothetical protein KFK09_010671 [Dendrobium nobile]